MSSHCGYCDWSSRCKVKMTEKRCGMCISSDEQKREILMKYSEDGEHLPSFDALFSGLQQELEEIVMKQKEEYLQIP